MISLPILRLENISLLKVDTLVLKGVSTTITQGEAIIITGPSGSGKTSLLRLLCRLDEPTDGCIYFQNEPISNLVPHEYRRTVALVFQTPVFFEGTVLHNLEMIDRMNHAPERSSDFYVETLKQVGLTVTQLKQEALSLSLGEKQRLAIARALLNQPKVLLLDEPISALDPDSATLLLTTLETLNKVNGLTILMVTHQIPNISIGTRSWHFVQGQIQEDKPL